MPSFLPDALAKISAKTPIGAVLRSKEWAQVPLALRERAQFSAGVESVRLLQTVQDRMVGLLAGQKEQLDNGKQATFDRNSFINSLREVALQEGLAPTDPKKAGTLQDITSTPRLGLIFDMQKQQAEGFARWKADQNEGALDLYPAWEFVRLEDRKQPRKGSYWTDRWTAAGGEFFGGRMIALKTSPVWAKLSIFGTPWEPFAWGSGMGREDIDRDTAISLGVMTEDTVLKPAVEDFNAQLKASAQGLDEKSLSILKAHFGDQVIVKDGEIQWRAAA